MTLASVVREVWRKDDGDAAALPYRLETYAVTLSTESGRQVGAALALVVHSRGAKEVRP